MLKPSQSGLLPGGCEDGAVPFREAEELRRGKSTRGNDGAAVGAGGRFCRSPERPQLTPHHEASGTPAPPGKQRYRKEKGEEVTGVSKGQRVALGRRGPCQTREGGRTFLLIMLLSQ